MSATHRVVLFAALLGCAVSATCATAQSSFSPAGGFQPLVPVSALARPAAWFDMSRLNLSTSVSVGTGFGGGSEALQVTSLSYRFARPVWMNVSVGNAWGPTAARNGSSLFLEGLDLGYRPFSSLQIQVHYRDLRSPLQYGSVDRPFGWGD
jgi:hypothetical protein